MNKIISLGHGRLFSLANGVLFSMHTVNEVNVHKCCLSFLLFCVHCMSANTVETG